MATLLWKYSIAIMDNNMKIPQKKNGNKNRMVIWSKSYYKIYIERKWNDCRDTRIPTFITIHK